MDEKLILHFEVVPKLVSFEQQIFNTIHSAIWLYLDIEVDKTSNEEHKLLEVEFSASIIETNRYINKISYLNSYKKDEYDALKARFNSITKRIQDDIRCVENESDPNQPAWLLGRYNLGMHSLNGVFEEIRSAIAVDEILIFSEDKILEKVPDVKQYFDDYKNVIEELKSLV